MEIKDSIIIATDFSNSPGARYYEDGDWSGQKFLDELLLPKFNKAVAGGHILRIGLDKVYGYPSSFVSGSFGKLSMEKGKDLVLKHIKLESDDNPLNIEKIMREIENPKG